MPDVDAGVRGQSKVPILKGEIRREYQVQIRLWTKDCAIVANAPDQSLRCRRLIRETLDGIDEFDFAHHAATLNSQALSLPEVVRHKHGLPRCCFPRRR